MKKIFLATLCVFASTKVGWCAPSLQDKACNQAISSVKKFVAPPKHKHEYYCSLHSEQNDYFVVRINSRYPAPTDTGPDWVGSNLVGYFAVSRHNGKVYNWDIAENKFGLALRLSAVRHLSSNQEANSRMKCNF